MDNTTKLKNIFVEVFDENMENINDESTPDTVEKWDSMGAVNLMMAIEQKFEIDFDILEIADLKSFALIKASLINKGISF